jgi:hypothetical protein
VGTSLTATSRLGASRIPASNEGVGVPSGPGAPASIHSRSAVSRRASSPFEEPSGMISPKVSTRGSPIAGASVRGHVERARPPRGSAATPGSQSAAGVKISEPSAACSPLTFT